MRTRLRLLFLALCFAVSSLAQADASASLTFYGFQMFPDETSRIFAHISSKPPLIVEQDERRLTFRLSDTEILVRNNKNPLNLEHFPTPAKRAQLVAQEGAALLVIELKQTVQVLHRFVDNVDGTVTLQIDFPALRSR